MFLLWRVSLVIREEGNLLVLPTERFCKYIMNRDSAGKNNCVENGEVDEERAYSFPFGLFMECGCFQIIIFGQHGSVG